MTAPRPRVEGEAWAPRMPSSVVQDEINYCTHKLDRTFRDEVDLRAYLYICQDWRDFQSRLARLTAEVERLRGVMEGEIEWLDGEAMRSREQEEAEARLLGVSPSTAPMVHFFNRKDKLRAALALPTPAPEATNDG